MKLAVGSEKWTTQCRTDLDHNQHRDTKNVASYCECLLIRILRACVDGLLAPFSSKKNHMREAPNRSPPQQCFELRFETGKENRAKKLFCYTAHKRESMTFRKREKPRLHEL